MTFDPTKNDKPCCLMDPADLRVLQECGGPWEFLRVDGEWEEIDPPNWHKNSTYRQKPQPKLWWVRVGRHVTQGAFHDSEIIFADSSLISDSMKSSGFRLMREVE